MVIDLSKLDFKGSPLLLVKNQNHHTIVPVEAAMNVKGEFLYNEISVLNFSVPRFYNGVKNECYDALIGMRIIEWMDVGCFILQNPVTVGDGVQEIKQCTAYSLEYEFTYKKVSLENATYNFWNPVTPKSTLLGILLSYMPSWSVGKVDRALIGKYRTFEVDYENIYDFIKNSVQETYSCIFEFDTFQRKVNVRDANVLATKRPVYFSTGNLAKEIEIEEQSENIVTVLDVNGAEGVSIRSVNPLGTNKIYNLDYFMNLTNFSQAMIDKWKSWKESFASNQEIFYHVTLNRSVQIARYNTEQAKLTDLKGDLSNLEAQQAVVIQAIAQGLSDQKDLDGINRLIYNKNAEISAQENLLASIQSDMELLEQEQKRVIAQTAFSAFFQADELRLLDLYCKEDSITDSSFAAATVKSYGDEGLYRSLGSFSFVFSEADVSKVVYSDLKTFYSFRGGKLVSTAGDFALDAKVIRGTLEYNSNKRVVCSCYLEDGSLSEDSFGSGTLSFTGSADSLSLVDAGLRAVVSDGSLFFTRNVTDYEQRQIEWDLYEYGKAQLERVSSPTYSFKITLENFFALEDYRAFCDEIALGDRVYVETVMGVLAPIVIGVGIDYDSPETVNVEFGSSFDIHNSVFSLKDLTQQSIRYGKTVDFNKYNYNKFVDSGAESSVRDFMNSALDVAKNAILSTSGQAISWDKSGLRLRKWKDESAGVYDPRQIWMANNSILFSEDNWQSAVIGIGAFVDENVGSCYGVVAPNIVGTLIAGENLVIESAKEDGGVSVFRVDGEGAFLHNADFNIVSGDTQITLNAEHGIGIGKYPLYQLDSEKNEVISEKNAKFWVDKNGNLYFKGTLQGANGVFSGELKAATGSFSGSISGGSINIGNGNFVVTSSGNMTANSGTFRGTLKGNLYQDKNGDSMMNKNYEFTADYLNLNGINVGNGNFVVDSSGNVSVKGSISMGYGSEINWSKVTNSNLSYNPAYSLADTANSKAKSAYNLADDASDTATSAYNSSRELRADIKDLVNGNYSGGSFINENTIYSPTLVGAEIYWGKTGTYGSLTRTYGSDGIHSTNIVELYSNAGIVLKAQSGMRFEADSLWINLDADDVHVKYNGRFYSLPTLIEQLQG